MSMWAVEVFSGASVEPEEGVPMTFGTPNITVGDDGSTSRPSVNLVYDPVGLRLEDDEAWLWINREDGSSKNFRFMHAVTRVELDWSGALRIKGMEERADGALVMALWEARPHVPTPEEREAAEKMLRDLGL